MKKKFLVIMSVFALSVMGINGNVTEVSAQEKIDAEQDYSYLLTEDAIVGQMETQTKGIYLSSGTSVIQDPGAGKIVAGGITSAATPCDVSVNVIVERLSGSTWSRVTSWAASKTNAWTVGSSKTLSVGSGYYYRVRCLHSANSDASSSLTGGLWR